MILYWFAVAANATAVVANLVYFRVWGEPVSLACAVFSLLVTIALVPPAVQTTRYWRRYR